ncbi:hypothetical protein [Nonomuraea sp. NPDC023979]|uniref:hypothetical protein n=1 Tax=Nonomuraea sp. NPDC023979 TaxID=3154796 RepID=UPI0033D21A03
MTTPPLTSREAIHEHWRRTGAAWRIEHRGDVRPSPGGTLIVYPRYAGSRPPWCIANHNAVPFPRFYDQPGVTRALALAERIELLLMADGKPFDWNNDAARKASHFPSSEIRTIDGVPLLQAHRDLIEAFNTERAR